MVSENSINSDKRFRFIVAIGGEIKCRDVIHEIYIQDKKRYYELYCNSKYFNNEIKGFFFTRIEESINEFIGIYESCCKDNDYNKIIKIISYKNMFEYLIYKEFHINHHFSG